LHGRQILIKRNVVFYKVLICVFMLPKVFAHFSSDRSMMFVVAIVLIRQRSK
jgi:hypothetical protein